MTRTYALIAAGAVAALLGGTAGFILLSDRADRFAGCGGGQVAGGGDLIGGPFTLMREDGVEVSEAEVIDDLTLVYFGYTFCPDVCPLDLTRNAEAVDLLEQRGVMIDPVFITVDPERDTPEVMASFTDYLHPRMVGLSGTREQVEAAKSAYRVYASGPGEGDNYLVDHTNLSYLMHPEEGFLGFFRGDLPAAQLADSVQCFAERL
ncbi:SCO family protein [Halovulum dunhuangense]|uniref:SCO family protein n=1 Tax=Halovulum dunhuangense TaxID=1505036 RepID=A0A849KV25_9RHOB|nr:SCO family protein [Halovulum dunhuangense]NNU79208.1 SCO family protein [Halovulum dunhuangense]